MDSRNALDSIHRDEFLMELTQGTSTQQQSQQGMTAVADMSSQKANFSYPRPDSRVIRHEPTDSRSSMTSNGSVPGMTDASDSEASADDDFHYNASASELWDSFWPNDTSRPQNVQQVQGSASPSIETSEYFTTTASPLKSERLDDGTLTIPSAEHQPEQLRSFQWPLPNPRNARPRPVQPRAPATFSICPKAVDEESTSSQTPIPARSTSLTPEAAPRPQHTIKRKPLRSSKSIANLGISKPRPHLHPLYEAPNASTSNSTIKQDIQSLPVSPAYPDPPAMSLRPSASAFDMRRQHAEDLEKRTYHNATAPLAPLPRPASAMAQRPARPQLERNVSVFECDSDDESDYEAESKFVRRLTRGLQHKKSTIGGDRGSSKTHGSSTLSPPMPPVGRVSRDGSETRKRGGSLGRILGLKGRSSS
ncbi:hypothetical protein PG996_007030 [Apiospora saccharicola]|uniref:Uncharacterized protein n=1 Tax=Apiospora saccharicola TaxID=335842 RepID=A0ABR1V9N7_9PEZI